MLMAQADSTVSFTAEIPHSIQICARYSTEEAFLCRSRTRPLIRLVSSTLIATSGPSRFLNLLHQFQR